MSEPVGVWQMYPKEAAAHLGLSVDDLREACREVHGRMAAAAPRSVSSGWFQRLWDEWLAERRFMPLVVQSVVSGEVPLPEQYRTEAPEWQDADQEVFQAFMVAAGAEPRGKGWRIVHGQNPGLVEVAVTVSLAGINVTDDGIRAVLSLPHGAQFDVPFRDIRVLGPAQ